MERIEFITRFQKERSFFTNAKVFDMKTGKEYSWPYQEKVEDIAYQNWIKDVTDPQTEEYYVTKKDIVDHVTTDGKEVLKTVELKARQEVNTIGRIRVESGAEFLISKGRLIGYNEFGDERRLSYSKIEMYTETKFKYERALDERTHKLRNVCQGPNGTEDHYLLPFDEEGKNFEKLYNMRDKKKVISLYISDALTGEAKQCKDIKMFKEKPFDYILNDDFLTERQKEQARKDFEALQTGLVAAREKSR